MSESFVAISYTPALVPIFTLLFAAYNMMIAVLDLRFFAHNPSHMLAQAHGHERRLPGIGTAPARLL